MAYERLSSRIRPAIALLTLSLAGSVGFGWGCTGLAGDDASDENAKPRGVGDAGLDAPGEAIDSSHDAGDGCTGFHCGVTECKDGKHTTLRGKVFDPSGAVPLGNVAVLAPDAVPLPPFKTAACDCTVGVSNIVSSAFSDTNGSFLLYDVPVGVNIPIAIAADRWRRVVVLPKVEPCTENVVPDGVLRMPRNHAEGDIPRTAIVTGAEDAVECALRNIGIDAAEITSPSGGGQIHLYAGTGATTPDTPSVDALWSGDTLRQYNTVILASSAVATLDDKPAGARKSLVDFVDDGGKVIVTHREYPWIAQGAEPFPRLATWAPGGAASPATATVDTTFPKGLMLSEWLTTIGASTEVSKVPIRNAYRDVVGVDSEWALPWLSIAGPDGGVSPILFGYDPYVEHLCGRMHFADFPIRPATGSTTFPDSCGAATSPSPEERILEFIFFDFGGCILSDPPPPLPDP